MNYGRIALRVLFILFMEVGSGLSLSFLYYLFIISIFDDFYNSNRYLNEILIYLVTLLPPFVFCLVRGVREYGKKDYVWAYAFIFASFIYLIGGLLFLLGYTDFYILNAGG